MSPTSAHPWHFIRIGGLDQVSLSTSDDLRSLKHLDPKYWVALSCPAKGLEIDPRTLGLIDTDGDGHIRIPEVVAAGDWASLRLAEPSALLTGSERLPIGAIASGTPEGASLLSAAKGLVDGADPQPSITAARAAEVVKGLSQGSLKGDGILRPEAASKPEDKALISDIASTLGPVTEATAATFFSDLEAYAAWIQAGKTLALGVDAAVAAEAFAAFCAVRSKVEDYFARCALAAFDAQASGGLNRREEDYRSLAGKELSSSSPELLALPLAAVSPAASLPLLSAVNPAWAPALGRLHRSAVAPLLGASVTELSPADWAAIASKLQPYEAWISSKPSSPVAKLGGERIDALLRGACKASLAALFAEDKALIGRMSAFSDLEKLALFHRDLGTLLRNFVNFSAFYSKESWAIFQAGTLYLDSRSCRLCIRVDDVGAHSALAGMSRAYVAYVDCKRTGGESMKLAACFTQGDSDYLFVGRNGVFYDRQGRDWDATIVKVIDSPISIRQSFFAPYKRVSSFVEEQFAKFAATKDQAITADLSSAAVAAPTAPAPASGAFDIGKFAGIFAAIGLAASTIGLALASVASGLMKLEPWQFPFAVAAALLVVSGPSMLLAALKLRQRNLGPLLEANGWAVNGRVKINIPLGTSLTDRASLPEGARLSLQDPFEDKNAAKQRRIWTTVVILVAAGLIAAKVLKTWPFHPAP